MSYSPLVSKKRRLLKKAGSPLVNEPGRDGRWAKITQDGKREVDQSGGKKKAQARENGIRRKPRIDVLNELGRTI